MYAAYNLPVHSISLDSCSIVTAADFLADTVLSFVHLTGAGQSSLDCMWSRARGGELLTWSVLLFVSVMTVLPLPFSPVYPGVSTTFLLFLAHIITTFDTNHYCSYTYFYTPDFIGSAQCRRWNAAGRLP